MTIRKLHIPASLALTVFFGCSTGTVLLVDDAAPRQAYAQNIDDGFFYANLAPHGQWFFQTQFGWVWHPARVNVGWRPYTVGQWVYANDVGWTWASQEPWGWATYHYGRWYFDPMYGWSWVPGRVWAPAWVSWRVEAGYIGWAPLWPAYFDRYPENRWDRWRHDGDWDRRHRGRDWDRWVFTRDRDFTSERVGRHAISDRRERDRIFRSSRDVTQYDETRPERIGHSIDRRMVEKATGRPVRPVRIEAADRPGERDDTRSDSIRMFRPRVKETSDKTPDRLGLAKEPAREAREADTIQREKKRLDSVPGKDKDKGRDRAATEPSVREKDNERGGGGPADNKPERADPAAGRARPDPRAPAAMDEGTDKRSGREPAAAGNDKQSEREPSRKESPDTRESAGQREPDKAAAPERKSDGNSRGTQEKAKGRERGATVKPEREQKRPVESEREAKPASEPAARERPASRAEQPSRSREAAPQAKSGKEPKVEPQRAPAKSPPMQPDRTQKQAPKQHMQPERTQSQPPKEQKQVEQRPERLPRESRPMERAPLVEQRSAPQQKRQADAPAQGKPESGRKKPHQDAPDDEPQGKGKS